MQVICMIQELSTNHYQDHIEAQEFLAGNLEWSLGTDSCRRMIKDKTDRPA